MSRLHMPGWMPAEVAERLSDTGGDIPKSVMEEARQDLVERLHNGRTVGGLTLRELIDCDITGSRAGFAAIELTNLVLADSGERAAMADAYVSGVIERWLETKSELVEERAEELCAEEPEPELEIE